MISAGRMAPSTGKGQNVEQKPAKKTPDLTRLPSSVVPKRYELRLDVEPELKKYSGQVNIRIFIEGLVNSNTIWLHSKNLEILSASIQFSQFALPIEASEIVEVPEKSCIGLSFSEEHVKLSIGTRAWIQITFKGVLSQSLEGFFSNPYIDENGTRRLGAATMVNCTIMIIENCQINPIFL